MKYIIKNILREETQKRSLKDVIFDDLVNTFNEERLIEFFGDDYMYSFKTIKSILNNEVIPHIESVYSLDYLEDEDFYLTILDKFARHLYDDDYPMVGDTIEMINMEDEVNAIPKGTKGVVKNISSHVFSGEPEEHLEVKWENGRTLKVLLPHDKIRIIEKNVYV